MDILTSMESSASCPFILWILAYKNKKGKKLQAPWLWGTPSVPHKKHLWGFLYGFRAVLVVPPNWDYRYLPLVKRLAYAGSTSSSSFVINIIKCHWPVIVPAGGCNRMSLLADHNQQATTNRAKWHKTQLRRPRARTGDARVEKILNLRKYK